jgi:hypothetical protein
MTKNEFDRVLDECLTRLKTGTAIEEILEEHGRFAHQLEPLLKAAYTAWALPKPDHQSSLREGRNRLMAEADRLTTSGVFLKNGTKSTSPRYSGQWFENIRNLLVGKENTEMKLLPRLALYGVLTVLIAGFFTVNASASSLPGDPLYGVKLSLEELRLALAFDDDYRDELEDEFEEERLDEVQALLGEGREEDVEFWGLIESKSNGSWVINGITVIVDIQTEIYGDLEIGDLVKVEALTQPDGSLLALEIYGEGFEDFDDIDDSDDEMDDHSDDEMDDDSDDEMSDDSDDEMSDDSDDEMSDGSDDEMSDDSDDEEDSDDSSDESEEEEEEEEDKEESESGS